MFTIPFGSQVLYLTQCFLFFFSFGFFFLFRFPICGFPLQIDFNGVRTNWYDSSCRRILCVLRDYGWKWILAWHFVWHSRVMGFQSRQWFGRFIWSRMGKCTYNDSPIFVISNICFWMSRWCEHSWSFAMPYNVSRLWFEVNLKCEPHNCYDGIAFVRNKTLAKCERCMCAMMISIFFIVYF